MTVVVDTNVLLVANGQHSDVGIACVAACSRRLKKIKEGDRIAIDDGFEVLTEYQNKTSPRTGKRPGDAFLKWLLRNRTNTERCVQVHLTPHTERGYDSFPSDPRLATFDRDDRKFVAVAVAHPEKPPILQAADSKWLGWSAALGDHQVRVEFLCPADIARFRCRKAGK